MTETSVTAERHFDVLIVGAGISGIGAAYYLQSRFPDRSFTILEGRSRIGGTWDLFRYPGVRSDSDMFTLGYSFRPWRRSEAIAEGGRIRNYLEETARAYGIDRKIVFDCHVETLSWSSAAARWTVTAKQSGQTVRYSCNFLLMGSGYYRYAEGYRPEFPEIEAFAGQVIHPQQWPDNLDYAGKRVVVIGSGATAVTLVPAMADKAGRVIMLQRSPGYLISIPQRNPFHRVLKFVLPGATASRVVRWQMARLQRYLFRQARSRPGAMRKYLIDLVRKQLPEGYDVETHFTPAYGPWEQRLCVVPGNDFFKAIRSGRASVVTDHIERFDETGIVLKSGEHIDADIVVTATGLEIETLGGASVTVDGQPVDLGRTFTYRGMMYSGIPNLVSFFGYVNASWTLRVELIARYLCRLLDHMDKKGYGTVTPVADPAMEPQPVFDF
jgi:monooxygenase